MKLFFHGFWPGFLDGTDSCTVQTFLKLLSNVVVVHPKTEHTNKPIVIEIAKSPQEADVLVESVFSKTSLVSFKKWRATIQFSCEPYYRNPRMYTVTLKSDRTHDNIVYFPVFAYYLEENGGLARFYDMVTPKVHRIPPKFCCFIVSNPHCSVRNHMFHRLSQYKHVDSCGKFLNNIEGGPVTFAYNSPEQLQFISQYKFIICFENAKTEAYITEKPINAYLARVVPIYWSTHYAKEIFHMESMVFLEDESKADAFDAVVERVKQLDQDDEAYLRMVNTSPFKTLPYSMQEIAASVSKWLPIF